MKRLSAVNASEKQNCLNCKYKYIGGTADGYFCSKGQEEITEKKKCWRYIKENSILDKLIVNVGRNWKFGITTIIAVLGILVYIWFG